VSSSSRLNYPGTHWLLYTARDRVFPLLPRSEIRNAEFRHLGSPKHRPSALRGFGSPKCRLSVFRKAEIGQQQENINQTCKNLPQYAIDIVIVIQQSCGYTDTYSYSISSTKFNTNGIGITMHLVILRCSLCLHCHIA